VTLRLLLEQTTLLITFQEPQYINTIKLFRNGPGTGPRKAPSYEMDRTFAEVLKDACTALTGFPYLREITDEISTLERTLGCPSNS